MNSLEQFEGGGKLSDYYPYAFHNVMQLGGGALLERSIAWAPPSKEQEKGFARSNHEKLMQLELKP